jgi:hypothetical protein
MPGASYLAFETWKITNPECTLRDYFNPKRVKNLRHFRNKGRVSATIERAAFPEQAVYPQIRGFNFRRFV